MMDFADAGGDLKWMIVLPIAADFLWVYGSKHRKQNSYDLKTSCSCVRELETQEINRIHFNNTMKVIGYLIGFTLEYLSHGFMIDEFWQIIGISVSECCYLLTSSLSKVIVKSYLYELSLSNMCMYHRRCDIQCGTCVLTRVWSTPWAWTRAEMHLRYKGFILVTMYIGWSFLINS